MAEDNPAGHGAPPPAAATPAAAITAPADTTGDAGGNLTIAEYARRKAAAAKVTGVKPAKGQEAAVQKQPDTAEPGPDKSEVLSQAAGESERPEAAAPDQTPAEAEPEPGQPQEEASPSPTEGEGIDETLPDDAPEWVQKRIARFTRQKGELERKLQEADVERTRLLGEVTQLKGSAPGLPVVIDQNDPASAITTEEQLNQTVTQARALKRWCERNPDGGTLEVADGKGGITPREFTAEQVRAMRESAEDDLEEHLPRRREYLQLHRAITQEALKDFPWLTDKSAPKRMELFNQVLANFPAVRLRPDYVRAVAIFVRGLETVEAERNGLPAMPKPKTAAPPPKVVAAPKTAPPRTSAGNAIRNQITTAEKEWQENPNHRTFARLQKLKREQRSESTG